MQKKITSMLCAVIIAYPIHGMGPLSKEWQWRTSIRSREDVQVLTQQDPEAAKYFAAEYSSPEAIDTLIAINGILDAVGFAQEHDLCMMPDTRESVLIPRENK